MRSVKKVLTTYREADEERRLNMFLAYRDLRQEFMSIDNEDLDHEASTQALSKENKGRVSTSLQWITGCCRYLMR